MTEDTRTVTDWTERRKSVADRWPQDGMPMSRFEIRSVVEWDAITKNPQKAEYHRRGLLNVVAALMDRVAALEGTSRE